MGSWLVIEDSDKMGVGSREWASLFGNSSVFYCIILKRNVC
jgi:hypothetical protein